MMWLKVEEEEGAREGERRCGKVCKDHRKEGGVAW
jgi:hypothetical protein